MKKILFIIAVALYVAGMNAQNAISQPLNPVQTEGCLKLKFPLVIFGKAGATYDTSTGKYKICPGCEMRRCAIVTVTVSFGYEVAYNNDNDIAILDASGNIVNIVRSQDVDLNMLQSKIDSGDFVDYIDDSTRYPLIFDGN